jgi:hypothetical protein
MALGQRVEVAQVVPLEVRLGEIDFSVAIRF